MLVRRFSVCLVLVLTSAVLLYQPVSAMPKCSCEESRHLFVTEPCLTGADVIFLQKELTKLGFYNGPIDGQYSETVELAVKKLQDAAGIHVDGIVGSETWAALMQMVRVVTGPPPPKPAGDMHIVIEVSKRTLTLYVDGKPYKTYPCAVGKPSTPSPVGEWVIISKSAHWGEGFGTRWMGLNVPWGIYGIHGTNKPYSIGTAASAGCIRMYNRDVEQLYSWVPIGTKVRIVGTYKRVKINHALRPGHSGRDVQTLQLALLEKGFTPGSLDGRYGSNTANAVKRLQKLHGLPLTGIADETVLMILGLD